MYIKNTYVIKFYYDYFKGKNMQTSAYSYQGKQYFSIIIELQMHSRPPLIVASSIEYT